MKEKRQGFPVFEEIPAAGLDEYRFRGGEEEGGHGSCSILLANLIPDLKIIGGSLNLILEGWRKGRKMAFDVG